MKPKKHKRGVFLHTSKLSEPAEVFQDKKSHACPEIRNYLLPPATTSSEPWLNRPELPSSEEIMGTVDANDDDFVDLVPNNIFGPWESKNAYLKAHYELLREDAVAPLRDAVAHVRENPRMMDNKVASIYEKVHIIGLTCASTGLGFRIQFSTHRAGKNIAWEYSNRLITGSLLALTPKDDAFRTKCVVAVVASRALESVKLKPPEIDIFFAKPSDIEFDPQKEWLMVEAKDGYFESVRHTMTALQKMDQEDFPLSDHICRLDPDIKPPEYVKANPRVDLHTIIDDCNEDIRVDLLAGWPSSPIGDCDATQWEALHNMLTKRLSIVQGPPGTGKTYVSVLALKILLSNMKPNDPPIIIASQTNHALDQLLGLVSLIEGRYIRLGARSSDPCVKMRTLFAIRKNDPGFVGGGVMAAATRDCRMLTHEIADLLEPFGAEHAGAPLSSETFKRYDLLTDAQLDLLRKGAEDWISSEQDDEIDPLVAWLGEEAVPFQAEYAEDHFGFEDEIDLEYEQLKELEGEQGLEDDGADYLKGRFLNLVETMCGRSHSVSHVVTVDHTKVVDLWKVKLEARGHVYDTLRQLLKDKVTRRLRELAFKYQKACKWLQASRWEVDHAILQSAKVIGMTATGLSKYRGLVSSLNPRIVVIEEAAEAIEAPIAAACFNSLQHLILVGDHQQLRGHCTVPDLEGDPFYLDVSMFERLVNNNLEYITLRWQRRMPPEVRQLLEPIYGNLEDHGSVLQRSKVVGMGDRRSFFFSHNWPESRDSFASKFNETEAQMIVGFFVYLLQNGVPVHDITILTFYNGQRKRLLSLLKKHPYLQGLYLKVVTVDSYQGEENEIVILSMVRSGGDNIGFLSIENRVCVALSRARCGFYIFGNATSAATNSALWARVLSIMKPQRVGVELPLTCVKHKVMAWMKGFIADPSEWEYINGGCHRKCGETLDCGHACSLKCHSFPHSEVECDSICNKVWECGHKCRSLCSPQHSCLCTSCKEDLATGYATAAATAEENVPVGPQADPRPEGIRVYQADASVGFTEHDETLSEKARANGLLSLPDLSHAVEEDLLLEEDEGLGRGRSRNQAVGQGATTTRLRLSVSLLDLYDD
ncbi:putative DEAD box helicase involved in nonsense mediated decay [Aspergillus saccharolyticus JOP 1030-1]|uniref:ATP binding protein n=1 Tax=Aspergillus saccharolyticus JOP 1030-1 TaxID=1450539 RepID=A0A318ZMD4_9EURO|nr:ATP binding protein [Aspergillus saccharolyticus JOP 1030-1]PYH48749.1 ATP binding protein [Aspergillus saccharolyticus JOP 1030-1]